MHSYAAERVSVSQVRAHRATTFHVTTVEVTATEVTPVNVITLNVRSGHFRAASVSESLYDKQESHRLPLTLDLHRILR